MSVTEWMGISLMKINNLGYLFKEGLRSIFLHGFMSFAAVCVTVACLLVVGSFSCLTYNLNLMVTNLNKTNEIMVYVDETLPDAEAKSVGTSLNRVDNIQMAEFMSRQDALDQFVADHAETDAFDGVSADTFRHRFRVTLKDNKLLQQTMEAIKAVPGVVKVSAAEELAAGFIMLQDVISVVCGAVNIVLLCVSVLIISNTVKLAMYDRRTEIAIMKMVGATNGFIRLPFIVQGFILGMLGAAVAFGLQWLMYDGLVGWIAQVDTVGFFSITPFTDILWVMVALFVGAGMLVGVVGSLMSIRRFMNV